VAGSKCGDSKPGLTIVKINFDEDANCTVLVVPTKVAVSLPMDNFRQLPKMQKYVNGAQS